MSDNVCAKTADDELGCIGRFNPYDTFCYRKCPLSVRCVIERNRQDRLEHFMDFLELEDIGPVDLQ